MPKTTRYFLLGLVLSFLFCSTSLVQAASSRELQVQTLNTELLTGRAVGVGGFFQRLFGRQIDLVEAATERKELMKLLADEDPEAFLRQALLPSQRQTLVTDIRSFVEQAFVGAGRLEILHIDDFVNYRDSEYVYYLNPRRTDNQRWILKSHNLGRLKPGDELNIAGFSLDDMVIFDPANITASPSLDATFMLSH